MEPKKDKEAEQVSEPTSELLRKVAEEKGE